MNEQEIEKVMKTYIKDAVNKLELQVNTITADPVRTAEAAALADTHPHWTTAHILDLYNRMLAVRAAIIAQGF